MKRFRFATACVLASLFVASAQAAPADNATSYITGLAEKALSTIKDDKLAKEKKTVQLEDLFATNVDMEWVGRFVMGRFWRQATDAQKKEYLTAYQSFLVSSYASRFAEYT